MPVGRVFSPAMLAPPVQCLSSVCVCVCVCVCMCVHCAVLSVRRGKTGKRAQSGSMNRLGSQRVSETDERTSKSIDVRGFSHRDLADHFKRLLH
jgi:hypothetical protein